MPPPAGPSRQQLTSTAPLTSPTPSPMAMVVSSLSLTPSKSSPLTTFPSLTRTTLPPSPMAQKTPRSPSQQPICSQASPIQNKVNSPSAVSPPMAVPSPRMEMALTSTAQMPTSTAPSLSTTPSLTPMVASLSHPNPLSSLLSTMPLSCWCHPFACRPLRKTPPSTSALLIC